MSGNYKGSYLTVLSSGGLVFGIINIVGNFGTIFVDNGYLVSAIVTRPSSTHKGYLLGGLDWFIVPFFLPTSLGLGALALDLPITTSEANHGLVPSATAIALMGKGGSILLLTMLFIIGIITRLSVASIEYGRVNLDTTGRNAPMLAGNLMSILTVEEFNEEKLIRAKAWTVKWGVDFTIVIVLLWPFLSLLAGRFSEGYFTSWAIIAIAWDTIGSSIIIVFPLIESWQTIQSVILGMFPNDRLMEKIEELNLKLNTIMLTITEAERIYLLEKGKAKKNEESEPDAHIVPA
ncbi:hypothetical protein ACSBR2_038745 [Camellia fascicularis]